MRTKIQSCLLALQWVAFLFLLPTANSFAQKFQNLYGNSAENYFVKIVPEGQNYYAVGYDNNYATVSHILNNGQLDWTIRFIAPCLLTDAAPVFTGVGQPPNLMVVGFTLPFDNTAKSLLAIVTPAGGLSYTQQYDFPGLEGFVRVTQKPGGTYGVVGFVNSPGVSNNVLLLDVSSNGTLNSANLYGNAGDNGYFFDIEMLGLDQLVAGYDGGAGVIFRVDNSAIPNFVAGVRDPSVSRYEDLATQGADIIAVGSPAAAGGRPLLRRFDANLFPIWTREITNLDAVRQVEVSPVNGDIYVVGTRVISGIDRTVVVRIDDNGGNPLPVWARYLDNGENAHATGGITILPSGDIALADGKTGISGGFGQGDAFMAVTNADMNSYCMRNINVTLVADAPFLESPELDFLDFTNLNPVAPLDFNSVAWQRKGVCVDPTPIVDCGHVKAFVEPEYNERRVGFDWDTRQTDFVGLEYDPPSGSMFPVGKTLVTATATDVNGTTATCSFNVTVEKMPYDSQQPPLLATPDGRFDRVRDQYGNPYRLGDLQVRTPGGTLLCSNSGYFNLYFEPGCGMEGNTPAEIARRNVLCQVFSDISDFIGQPNPLNPATVNIAVRDLGLVPSVPNPATSGVLGVGSSFFVMPAGAPAKGGIADNEIWKTINSGVDSYTGFVSPLTVQMGGGFYHGFVAFNFVNTSLAWHTDLLNFTNAGTYDLYTIALHEVAHALGFASLIVNTNNTGASFFAPGFPRYFSRYDSYLKSPASLGSLPLIVNPGACSPMYDYDFNSALANTDVLAPNPTSLACNPDNTVCNHAVQFTSSSVNQAVFTPNCFFDGSSLSHFEDVCRTPVPQPNNQYYVMANMISTGQTYMKRYLKPEERQVLCQLGYRVQDKYGNLPQKTFFDYLTTPCNLLGVAGVNDGIGTNGSFLYTVVPGGTSVAIFPLTNDVGAVMFECLEPVFGTGIPSTATGTSFTYAAPATPGINLLRYVPVSATGARGNITYILIYVEAPGCPADACSLVGNVGFEAGTGCGGFYPQNVASNAPVIDCWASLAASPDLFTRTCTSPGTQVDVSTFNSVPPSGSYNGSPNDKFMGFFRGSSFPQAFSEAAQARLSTPLIPGQLYTISLWAKTNNNINGPSSNIPARIEFASDVNFPLAHVLQYLPGTVFQPLFPDIIVPNDNQWHFFSQSFTFNGSVPHSNLIVAYGGLTLPSGTSGVYFFLDDVQLQATPTQLTFMAPDFRCVNDPPVLLNNTVSIPGGVFVGTAVTLSGTNYYFHPAQAGPGTHTITYTITDANGCTSSAVDSIRVDSCQCVCAADAVSLFNGDSTYILLCNTHGAQDLLLGCPAKDLIISGFFGCTDSLTGDLCDERDVWWELTYNGAKIDFGTTTPFPVFFFSASQVDDPGLYCLTRWTICPGRTDTCMCKIRWVQVSCDTCECKGFEDMQFYNSNWPGVVSNVKCDSSYTLPCLKPGTNPLFFFHGDMKCNGHDCLSDSVKWQIVEMPAGNTIQSGMVPLNPTNQTSPKGHFDIYLDQSWFKPGTTYMIIVTGMCGGKTCTCKVTFKFEQCPCLCDPLATFWKQVGKGFLITGSKSSCKRIFRPIALCPNDQVTWTASGPNLPTTTYGPTTGNAMLMITFPGPGLYNVCMFVKRTEPGGKMCEREYCGKVYVKCGMPPGGGENPTITACTGGDRLRNGDFSEGLAPGHLGQGGTADGWNVFPNTGDGQVLVDTSGASDDGQLVLIGGAGNFAGIYQKINVAGDTAYLGFNAVHYFDAGVPAGTRLEFRLQTQIDPPGDPSPQVIYQQPLDSSFAAWNAVSVALPIGLNPDKPYLVVCLQNDNDALRSVAGVDNLEFCTNKKFTDTWQTGPLERLRIFPNPTPGQFTVELSSPASAGLRFRVVDLAGRLVLEAPAEPGSARQTMEAGVLPNGLYFLQVLSEGRVRAVEKFVKQ